MKSKLQEPIELRGHHFSVLANYYLKGLSIQDLHPYLNKDLENTGTYGITKLILSTLLEKSNHKIKTVSGLDSICSKCAKKNEVCDGKNSQEDPFTLREYDLKLGNIYSTEEIVERIKKYPLSHGSEWKTPRHIWIACFL